MEKREFDRVFRSKLYNWIVILFVLYPFMVVSQNKEDIVVVEVNPQRQVEGHLRTYLRLKLTAYILFQDTVSHQKISEYVDSSSLNTYRVFMELKKGTFWEVMSPPAKPPFFQLKLLFGSSHPRVEHRLNYLEFLSIWEKHEKLPYDMIKQILVERIIDNDEEVEVIVNYIIGIKDDGSLYTKDIEVRAPE